MISLLEGSASGLDDGPQVTLCNQARGAGNRLALQGVALKASQRAGVRRAARGTRERTLPHLTQSEQRGCMSHGRRRAHHEQRITEAPQPWTKFLKSAEWLTSEIKHLSEHDPRRAQEIATSLIAQTQKFAETLNTEAAERRSR